MRSFSYTVLAVFVLSLHLPGSVAPNPFLRPGSMTPAPPVAKPPPPPVPQVNPDLFKEVEFRGYFLLNGVPHFCIFNKKSNFGEWIQLSESTYEDYEAEAFDLQSETLTVAFNGQSFKLTLQESQGASANPASPSSVPKLPNASSNASNASSTPKVMPPKPKSTPQLPDWLVQRSRQNASSARTNSPIGGGSSGRSLSPGRPILPGGIPPRQSVPSVDSSNAGSAAGASPSSSSSGSVSNLSSPVPRETSSTPTSIPSPTGSASFGGPSDGGSTASVAQDEEIDLSTLPPPPPPPNILPPTGPPDLQPSKND